MIAWGGGYWPLARTWAAGSPAATAAGDFVWCLGFHPLKLLDYVNQGYRRLRQAD